MTYAAHSAERQGAGEQQVAAEGLVAGADAGDDAEQRARRPGPARTRPSRPTPTPGPDRDAGGSAGRRRSGRRAPTSTARPATTGRRRPCGAGGPAARRQTSAAAADTTMAMSTRLLGREPAARPRTTTSVGGDQPAVGEPVDAAPARPRASPSAVAVHPRLWLWPSTSQNGSPGVAPVTSTRARSWSSSTDLDGRLRRPFGAGRRLRRQRAVPSRTDAPPPALGAQHQRGRCRDPASRPWAVSISWSPPSRADRRVAAHARAGAGGRP